MAEKWYSSNGEDYSPSIEDAVHDALGGCGYHVGMTVSIWEGDAIVRKAGEYLPKWQILDLLMEEAYDDVDDADGWLDGLSPEQKNDLDTRIATAINAWADANGLQPRFGTVENAREVRVKIISAHGIYAGPADM